MYKYCFYNCFIIKKLSAFFDVVETAKKRSF